MAVGLMIAQSIGHAHTKAIASNLSTLCSNLGYDQARFGTMLAEVVTAYQADRGCELIERTFADDEQKIIR